MALPDDTTDNGDTATGDYGWFSSAMQPTKENFAPSMNNVVATDCYYGKYRSNYHIKRQDEFADGMQNYKELGDVARRETDRDPVGLSERNDDVFNWPVEPPS